MLFQDNKASLQKTGRKLFKWRSMPCFLNLLSLCHNCKFCVIIHILMNCVIQISERERARYHAEEMLDAERERSQLINQEWENLKETREVAEKKLQQLQDRLRSVCTKI